MSLTPDDVRHLARLARLRLTDDETEQMIGDLGQILDYMGQIAAVDTVGVEPTMHPFDVGNRTRPDAVEPRITRDEALRNAPDHDDAYVRVPKTIDG